MYIPTSIFDFLLLVSKSHWKVKHMPCNGLLHPVVTYTSWGFQPGMCEQLGISRKFLTFLDWNQKPKIHVELLHGYTVGKSSHVLGTRSLCSGSILKLRAIYYQHQTPSISSIKKHPLPKEFWNRSGAITRRAGFGMRSGVFCSLGKGMKVVDTGCLYQISSWFFSYWFLWSYIGFSWRATFEAFKSLWKMDMWIQFWVSQATTRIHAFFAHCICGYWQPVGKLDSWLLVQGIDYYAPFQPTWACTMDSQPFWIGQWSSPCGFVSNQSRVISPTICRWHEQGKLQGIVLDTYIYIL